MGARCEKWMSMLWWFSCIGIPNKWGDLGSITHSHFYCSTPVPVSTQKKRKKIKMWKMNMWIISLYLIPYAEAWNECERHDLEKWLNPILHWLFEMRNISHIYMDSCARNFTALRSVFPSVLKSEWIVEIYISWLFSVRFLLHFPFMLFYHIIFI